MSEPFLRIIDPGLGATLQDQGRHGWRRFGVPTSGAMDLHAAAVANRLLGNPPWAPVVEFLLQGAKIEPLQPCWVALCGADQMASVPLWRAVRLEPGKTLTLGRNHAGIWAYLAIEGGFACDHWLDSASTLAAAHLGRALRPGDLLGRVESEPRFSLPAGVGGRSASRLDQWDYHSPPPLRVHPAPQTAWFSDAARAALFATAWTVAPQSNRVGYRLDGPPLPAPQGQMISEPIRVGSIQVPPGGQPLVIMRDGPTIGGYPKIGLLEPADVNWLAQCRPGQSLRFVPAES